MDEILTTPLHSAQDDIMDAQDDIVWIRSSRLRYATLENVIVLIRSSRLRYATLEDDNWYAQCDDWYVQCDDWYG